ncbi:LysE family transporter [Altererythrobacter salegens]|uniref:LysE family transporter n=1 Tax=Croceibacterium salegens TaxID=1737568 RepID=A0A6I4SS47_9SPHN|nr:LysE family translocator [Croceibacterium salegens]MXO58744.1 LysE family transporter [Croceibacterium salegens]
MIDAEMLAAFAVVTGLTSIVPGPSMLFVMTETLWRGARSGFAALIGMQLGYLLWWALAALGLGTLAKTYPFAMHLLAVGGALYLAWLGLQALRNAGSAAGEDIEPAHAVTRHAFRDGIMVAIGNPKSLIYVVALLPPFIAPDRPVIPQLAVLWMIGMLLDLAIGGIYIYAGKSLSRAMDRPGTRLWIDRGVGAVFIVIALAILYELLSG